MSYQAIQMAKAHRVGNPTYKAILYAIAERCHADGRGCTSRYATIADESEASLRSVKRAIPAMLEAGVLRRDGKGLAVAMDTPVVMNGCHTGTFAGDREAPKSATEAPAQSATQAPTSATQSPNGATVAPRTEPSTTVRQPKPHRRKPEVCVPEVFVPSASLLLWAKANAPNVDLTRETAAWLEHHRSKDNRFRDWDAAWRKWMSNAEGWRKKPATGGPRGPIDTDRADLTTRLAL